MVRLLALVLSAALAVLTTSNKAGATARNLTTDAITATAARAAPPIKVIGDLHDPTITKYGSKTYCAFGTGIGQTGGNPGGIRMRTATAASLSMNVAWHDAGAIAVPAWAKRQFPTAGNLWAPDIYYEAATKTYYMYYAVSLFGTRKSAIGVAQSKTPCNKNSWVDKGKILSSSDNTPYNAIDPNVFRDAKGVLWMQFGSWSGGIYMTKMASPTAVIASNAVFLNVAERSNKAVEGATMMYHGGYYFLFSSWDHCCQGASSNYNTRVGRSTSASGPFVGQRGMHLTNGGGSHFLSSTGNAAGTGGGDGFVDTSLDGKKSFWFIFHYYDKNNNGAVRTALQEIAWSAANWPLSSMNG